MTKINRCLKFGKDANFSPISVAFFEIKSALNISQFLIFS